MAKTKKTPKAQAEEREVIYETPSVHIAAGDEALDAPAAKELLGWEETDDKELAILTDRNGKRIFCRNNLTNRPLTMSNVDALLQEMLRRRWRLNGENIIVGRTGLLLNGQHTLIALVLAEQDRENDFRDYSEDARKEYRKHWPNPIQIDKSVFYGVEETDEVVNTMDTCKPRSLWEVICRSPHFASMKAGDRRTASKLCEHAVRMIWHRTGAGNAFNLRRTHAESLDFINRHPTLLNCVKHVFEEDGGKDRKIASILSPGYAAGLLYLMVVSASDGEKYYDSNAPAERHLDLANRDKAETFWTLIAQENDPEFKIVREAVAVLNNAATGAAAPLPEKVAVIVKAWACFLAGDSFTRKRLELRWEDQKLIDGDLTVGGIDRGPNPKDDEDDEMNGDEAIPTPEELMERKEQVRKEAIEAKREEAKTAKKAETPAPTKAPRVSAKEQLRQKHEADARAADEELRKHRGEEPSPSAPTPPSDGIDPKTGFKARPTTVKINPPKPTLRGGIG